MAKEITPVTTKDVEERIITLRGKQVLLDCDVADLYGVETKRINEAVKNNPDKFPARCLFKLEDDETKMLVNKPSDRKEKVADENSDRKTVSRMSRYNPTAFTERGLYMLATILKSPRATQTTLAIIDTFVAVREMARTMESLQSVADGGEQQQSLLQKTGQLLANVVGQNLATSSSETEIELNFAVVKIKHKFIHRNKDD